MMDKSILIAVAYADWLICSAWAAIRVPLIIIIAVLVGAVVKRTVDKHG